MDDKDKDELIKSQHKMLIQFLNPKPDDLFNY